MRPAGPVKAPTAAGGAQVVVLASPGNPQAGSHMAVIFYSVAVVYASWYLAAPQRDSISSRSLCFCHESWKFKLL